ncbi:MAG TPA: hypothetical protein DFL85_17655 [Lentisphaeria bacterium]|jgi:hypothetical protein|nr:hypothetical protein C5Q97_02170 [Victivallales bacterium CCUG 44730]HBP08151.1 hypothetical protein [Lentisphaeria bacterium]HCH87319.1 hypothetical protein [Lentisphaeria bacterium]
MIIQLPDGVGRDWYKFEIIQHTCPVDKITQTSFDYDLNIEIIKGIIDFFLLMLILLRWTVMLK